MRLLLISNSTNPGEPYLDYPKKKIGEFLGDNPVKALFLPYAAVTFSYDAYEKKVSERFQETGHNVVSVHHYDDPVKAVSEASAIVVGGGNTWKLIKNIQDKGLIDIVRQKVLGGTPYIGWSAGSNVACPTIKTTNDMPVMEPRSFNSFNLIPFQINPHYLDANPAGHAGETREQRIEEFIEANPDVYVAGLREGTMLLIENEEINLFGPRKARIFRKGKPPIEVGPDDDLTFLLERES
ncbi:MAG: dipeptidase PepE [Bacteroidetes bacterium]|jgi:dipeptidase E|nr:dipeptidase PepE [Bacteroidota bacterium]